MRSQRCGVSPSDGEKIGESHPAEELAADPVGHYSRPDVLRLVVNRNPAPRVVEAPAPVVREPEVEEFPPAMTSA
jgi:hypothetical protein